MDWTPGRYVGVQHIPVDPVEAARYAEQAERQRVERDAALQRALNLLEAKIGPAALAKIQAGGAYTVRSKWWPNVTYLVPKESHARIKVVADGSVVTESCLVTTDHSLPWPDVLLHRLTAIEMDESVLFATGVLTQMKKGKWTDKLKGLFKSR